jgi:hypothetical protein
MSLLKYKPLNKQLTLGDGTKVSVQASRTHYCFPRDDGGPYLEVEVGFPSVLPDWWDEYAEDPGETETVAGFVPVGLVREFIEEHGGIVSGDAPEGV